MASKSATPRIVVLKADRFYGDMICRQIKGYWRGAQIQVFQKGFDALDSIQANSPDMFVTGVQIEDMDGLEHMEPFIERDLPILIVTARKDARTLCLLRDIRYNGLFDVKAEQVAEFHSALQCVIERGTYVSPTFAPHVKKPKNLTIDTLTAKEEMVLSIIGDGSDDALAAERLCLSPHTINTHRKTIMAKLGLHHKGQIMCYAVQKGYVRISADGVTRPGFQRVIQNLAPGKKASPRLWRKYRNEEGRPHGRPSWRKRRLLLSDHLLTALSRALNTFTSASAPATWARDFARRTSALSSWRLS